MPCKLLKKTESCIIENDVRRFIGAKNLRPELPDRHMVCRYRVIALRQGVNSKEQKTGCASKGRRYSYRQPHLPIEPAFNRNSGHRYRLRLRSDRALVEDGSIVPLGDINNDRFTAAFSRKIQLNALTQHSGMNPDYVVGSGVIVWRASEDFVPYFMLVNLIRGLFKHTLAQIEKHVAQSG